MLTDHSLLQAALEGLELKRSKLNEHIAQVKLALSGKSPSTTRPAVAPAEAKKGKVSKKRILSPEARERIAAAQKARWAKARGEV